MPDPNPSTPRTILVISQTYVPDPAAVGQHIHDAAADLARRGHRVITLTANRGFDDPTQRYPARESRDRVTIRRLPLSSFGKRSILMRVIGSTLFLLQVIARALFTRRLSAILISTSPPFASAAALVIRAFRRVPITYWIMDINPDQAVIMGRFKPTAFPVRCFDALNRAILRRARHVVTLDRFMADRTRAKLDVTDKLTILPPWSPTDDLAPLDHADNPFRAARGLIDKFVIMYSGNIGHASSINTILEAAQHFRDDPRLLFLFIGGGVGKPAVDDFIQSTGATNIRSLPYQPLDQLKYSLAAADVHLVVVAPRAVGISHPCKVYGAMAVARPILLLGPDPCHVSDIIADRQIGWRVDPDNAEAAIQTIQQIITTDPADLAAMGARAKSLIDTRFNRTTTCRQFCDLIDRDLWIGSD